MKAIMYHYIRESNNEFPYFKYLDINNFVKQLDFFESRYGFVTKKNFIDSVSKPLSHSRFRNLSGKIVLTFDDAFKDHFKYVFPELKKRGLWGIFYIPFAPFTNEKILDVHRVHLLLGKFSSDEISATINNIVNESMLSHLHIEEYHSETYNKQNNDEATNHVKRLLNYFIDYKFREEVIDQLMRIYFPNEKEITNNFYMTLSELKKMSSEGMLLGSHTVNHPVMSRLTRAQQEKEILRSFNMLDKISQTTIRSFAYPYGGFHSFNADTEQLLDKHKCRFAFNVESRDINLDDLRRKQALPRYDCNNFPHGSVN